MRSNAFACSLLFAAVMSLCAPSATAALSIAPAPSSPSTAPRGDDKPVVAPVIAPEAAIASARAALVARLVELANWCRKVELFEESDKVWAQILVIDPKNLDAHKGLQHARSTDGTWRETNRHVTKNRSTKSLPELPGKRAEAMKPFSTDLIERAKKATDPVARDAYVAAVVAIDADDPTLHAYEGDVKDGDRWVLPETVGAKDRRARIKALIKSALDEAPQTKPELLAETDPRPAFDWSTGVTTGSVRVFSSGLEDDAKQLARTCTAAGSVVQALFGPEFKFPPHLTFYLLEPTQKDALLATFTTVDDAERARMARLEGSGLPNRQDVALWTGSKPRTLDAAVRHTLSYLFGRGIELKPSCGWVWEGTGLYLTREIVGTRLTWFVSPDTTATASTSAALKARLLAQDANWMSEGLTLLTGPNPPKMGDVMKRDLGQLEVRDVVVSYVLTAYLLESRPDQALLVMRRSAAGEDPDAITHSVLTLSTDELSQRLVRWLSERK